MIVGCTKPKDEFLAVLKILSGTRGSPKMMKKNRPLEQIEKAGVIDKNLANGLKITV
jgi:hypothetical protein